MDDREFRVTVPVRFRDLDPLGHIDNAVNASYIEHARARSFRSVAGESLDAADAVLVHLSIDYRASIDLDDDAVEVAMWISRLGPSSIPIEYELRASGAVAATAETV